MLNLIKSLNYEINADGVVQKVHVGFSEYNGNPGGSINVTILPEEVEGPCCGRSQSAACE